MTDAPRPASSPDASPEARRAERRAALVSLMGEANVRELEANPVTDEQRRQLTEIVRSAPRRLA